MERKGKDNNSNIPTYVNFIITTQNPCPIKLEGMDQRHALFKCNEEYYENKKYFSELGGKIMNQKCGDNFFTYLSRMETKHLPIPETEFRKELKEACKPRHEIFLEELKKGEVEIEYSEEETKFVSSDRLFSTYCNWCKDNNVKYMSKIGFCRALPNMGFRYDNKPIIVDDGFGNKNMYKVRGYYLE